jgi:excisionase family DNA binding protein
MKTTEPTPASQNAVASANSILTIEEVARELKCSKSHVYNINNGRVPGVKPMPTICLGRKKLVRRGALDAWKVANETNALDATLGDEPVVNTVGA